MCVMKPLEYGKCLAHGMQAWWQPAASWTENPTWLGRVFSADCHERPVHSRPTEWKYRQCVQQKLPGSFHALCGELTDAALTGKDLSVPQCPGVFWNGAAICKTKYLPGYPLVNEYAFTDG